MTADEAIVRVYRFNPAEDEQPRYEMYSVPFHEDWFLLDALSYIYEHLDGSLAFRQFKCMKGVCQSCNMVLNGKKVLACAMRMQREMQVDPLPDKKLIRDLVVEFD